MIGSLEKDLESQILEMEMTEKDSQEDYEKFMADSADKRALDSKAITDKEASKAALEEELEANKGALKTDQVKLMDVEKYIMELHKECDFLLEKYTLRKDARAGEIDALGKAKAVLNGADYSLVQTSVTQRSSSTGFLRAQSTVKKR